MKEVTEIKKIFSSAILKIIVGKIIIIYIYIYIEYVFKTNRNKILNRIRLYKDYLNIFRKIISKF